MTPIHIADKAAAHCIACDRYYPTAESLLEHVDEIHGRAQDDVIETESDIMYFIGKIGDGDGPAFCSCCDRHFPAHGVLADHVSALHGGGKFGYMDSMTAVLQYIHTGEPANPPATLSPLISCPSSITVCLVLPSRCVFTILSPTLHRPTLMTSAFKAKAFFLLALNPIVRSVLRLKL